MPTDPADAKPSIRHVSTRDVARRLGLAVRSVQMMVDRGELEAWKTPGGHRRIVEASVDRWIATRRSGTPARSGDSAPRVLLIEDSKHYQNLVSLLLRQHVPDVRLSIADDGIAGLAMTGRLAPDLLIVDILLPGIDGAMLIATLRSDPQFAAMRLVVITSLDEAEREPYRFSLEGVPVVHKSRLAVDLVGHVRAALESAAVAA